MRNKWFAVYVLSPLVIKIINKIKRIIKGKSCSLLPTEKSICYSYLHEIDLRKRLPATDIVGLAAPFSKMDTFCDKAQLFISNGDTTSLHYGMFSVLKKYVDDFDLFSSNGILIQHGFHIEGKEPLSIFDNVKKYLCWGKREESFLNGKIKSEIHSIGAPFFYADSLLSEEEISSERKRLGRNLLVFPSHSLLCSNSDYNMNEWLSFLRTQRKEFDTVRICLYWADVLKGAANYYKDKGYECVCCGNISDFFFLNRQRSLIEIADCTLANSVGSNLGFSLYLQKPHCIYNQEIKISKESERIPVSMAEKYARIKKLFSPEKGYTINEKQKELVKDYWGTDCIKTQADLWKILNT